MKWGARSLPCTIFCIFLPATATSHVLPMYECARYARGASRSIGPRGLRGLLYLELYETLDSTMPFFAIRCLILCIKATLDSSLADMATNARYTDKPASR